MSRRANSWFLILLVGVIAVLALPRHAAAQATTGGISMAQYNPVVRQNDTSKTGSTTDSTIKLTITHDDCLNSKLKFKFSVAVPGYQQTYDVQAWAGRGSDCAAEFVGSPTIRTCWKLGNLSVTNAVATGEFTSAQLLGIGASDGKRILTNSCDDPVEGKGRQSFYVTFMFTDGSNTYGNVKQTMYYSLVGPDAPPLNDVLASDQSLQLQWGTLSGVTTEVTYEFFCVENQVTSGCKSTVLESFGSTYGTDSSGGTGGTSSTSSTDGGSTFGGAATGGQSTSSGGTTSTGTTDVATATAALEDGTAGSAGTAGDGGAAGMAGDFSSYFTSAGERSIASAGAAGFVSTNTTSAVGGSETATTSSESSAGATAVSAGEADVITPMDPKTLGAWRCGSKTGRLSSSGYTDPKVKPLTNDKSYAVALAVRDTYGNLGALSNYKCQTPVEIETFYERYRAAGGKGGGGFCNLDIHPRRSTLPVLLGAIGLTAWLRRRQRPSSRRPAKRGKSS